MVQAENPTDVFSRAILEWRSDLNFVRSVISNKKVVEN